MPTTEIPTSEVPGAGGGGGGATWSRWLSAADLTLADANSVTIVSAPSDVGDEITVTTRNLSGGSRTRVNDCAIYTFDMSQLLPAFDSTKDQVVDMQLEFSAFPVTSLLTIGPTENVGTAHTMAVGQYGRGGTAWHAIEMHANFGANRGAGTGAGFIPLMWGNFISEPDWSEGVVGQIIGEITVGSGTSGAGSNADFAGVATSFAVILGLTEAADTGDIVTTFKARFAVRDLTP